MKVQDQIEQLRTQRAAEWLQTLREESSGSEAEFVRWITESPRNLEEFLKLDALSRETRAVLASGQFNCAALLEGSRPKMLELKSSTQESISPPPVQRLWARGWAVGIAASVAIALLAGIWAYEHFLRWDNYSTGSTQQRTVRLTDGSQVYLNAGSTLTVRLGGSQRRLRLLRGEALFDVAPDKRRPFRVSTRDAVVEAVGTQFNVSARGQETRVAVIEGKVRITRDAERQDSPGEGETALEAGEAARVTRMGRIQLDRAADVAAAVAWSRPELVFEGTPLEEAVNQFNRHRRSKPLRLEGVLAGSHHYSGIFNATDAESFAALLTRERDLEVTVGEKEILIRQR